MTDDDASVHEMTRLLRNLDRDRLALDDGTAERLLGAGLSKDDAPPEYRRVAEALALLAVPATAAELEGEQPAVASIAARLAAPDAGSPRRTKISVRRVVQLSLASVAGGVALLGGLAAANALPGAAQGVASDVLGNVGISVPNPNAHAGSHPDTRGDSGSHPGTPPSNHGGDVSDVARNTTATGADKGAAVSNVASDGRSQAGDDHASNTTPTSTPPVSVPNDGGTGTADTASDGHSSTGTGTADTSSDGHSADGSGNAVSGLANKP